MKRSLAILLALSLSASLLVGCGGDELPQNATSPTPHTPCHEPFSPEEVTLSEPDTTALTAAEAAFAKAEPATAEQFTIEHIDGGVRLTAYHGEGGCVVIPETLDGVRVVSLGNELFRDNESLSALFIPDSVTEIGTNLLTSCRKLNYLRIPQLGAADDAEGFLAYFFGGDTPVGKGFLVPASLEAVILGPRVTSIPDHAFYECSRLVAIRAEADVSLVGDFAFYACLQLGAVELWGIEALGSYAFAECAALTCLAFEAPLKSVGEGILYHCTALQQLTFAFSDSIPFLGYLFGADTYHWNATHVPTSLVSVTLTDGDIPDYAFYGCEGIRLITPSEHCTSVGIRAFYGCSALQSIALPSGTANLGDMAMAYCTSLAKVTLPAGLTSLGIQVFTGCTNLTEITLPDTLTSLPASTFAECCNLRTVALGSGMSSIGAQAFRHCSSLATVSGGKSDMTVGEGNELLSACLNQN